MIQGLGHNTVIHASCGAWVVSVRLSPNSRYLEVYICYTTKKTVVSLVPVYMATVFV